MNPRKTSSSRSDKRPTKTRRPAEACCGCCCVTCAAEGCEAWGAGHPHPGQATALSENSLLQSVQIIRAMGSFKFVEDATRGRLFRDTNDRSVPIFNAETFAALVAIHAAAAMSPDGFLVGRCAGAMRAGDGDVVGHGYLQNGEGSGSPRRRARKGRRGIKVHRRKSRAN